MKHFIQFKKPIDRSTLPKKFTFPFRYTPHPLCLIATEEIQEHLKTQTEWNHNFGLEDGQEGAIIGKMFGVLVVENEHGEIGYLAAFSGKLAYGNHHSQFVPPVFDMLTEDGFFSKGMMGLKRMTDDLDKLKKAHEDCEHKTQDELDALLSEIQQLKKDRKQTSINLQQRLFDNYHFLNSLGETKSLMDIFSGKKPPSGSGECAAPKLLQYAFLHKLRPICMAEFWWGKSPVSEIRKHGNFYPACQEKCAPILSYMLVGIEMIS